MSARRASVDDGETRKIRSSAVLVGRGDPLVGLVRDQVRRDQAGAAGRGQVTGERRRRRTARSGSSTSSRPPAPRPRPRPPRCRSTSAGRTPPASAISLARWITGPSMTGSEYGKPTSMRSTPALGQRPDGGDAALDGRETGRQVADQGRPALGPGLVECHGNTHGGSAHSSSTPNQLPAVVTSLSPRPGEIDQDRGIRSQLLGQPRPAPASACALSMAGMMPSVRQSSWNASIASASVTGS